MYEYNYVGINEMSKMLGFGLNKTRELCRNKPHGFPVIKLGNRYQADEKLLAEWQKRLYSGEFDLESN